MDLDDPNPQITNSSNAEKTNDSKSEGTETPRSTAAYSPRITEMLPICITCGTQFEWRVTTCKICDDPRQYVPPSGQSFTTLAEIRSGHKNIFTPLSYKDQTPEIVSITTEPKFAIGQRAILIRTALGMNILWDCITLLDEDTIAQINKLGGIHAIFISHPHYYSTHLEWAEAFNCPVFISQEDKGWVSRTDLARQVLIEQKEMTIRLDGIDTGAQVVKLGGHFPGSLVLLYKERLFIADTVLTTPSGIGNWSVTADGTPRQRPEHANSYAFMWSIPNYIPLSADEIYRMWCQLNEYYFTSTHGAFAGQDIEEGAVKQRMFDSAKRQVQAMGWTNHPMLLNKFL